jgi:cyclophilin family peptidyl-prolyl cis-trans isomerase
MQNARLAGDISVALSPAKRLVPHTRLTPSELPVESSFSEEVPVTKERLARRTRTLTPLIAAAALGAALVAGASLTGADAPSLKAILEVDRDAYYAGDPVPVRLSIWNDSSTAVPAPSGEIPAGFELFDIEGKRVTPVGVGAAAVDEAGAAASRPLTAGAFVGYARDLTILYPKLKETGTYRLQWRQGSIESNAVILRVVPRYDPDKDYTARIDTDMGTFTIELLRKDAPIAVKTFVDLAQDGFYDGLSFHYVETDRVVAGGDPTGTGQGGPGFHIPHERTQNKMLAGTVILMAIGRPPANGSAFAILLAPRPDYEGKETGFAQVIEGLDVVKRISNVPASAKEAPMPHHPLKEVKILRIVVKPKTAA